MNIINTYRVAEGYCPFWRRFPLTTLLEEIPHSRKKLIKIIPGSDLGPVQFGPVFLQGPVGSSSKIRKKVWSGLVQSFSSMGTYGGRGCQKSSKVPEFDNFAEF